jgi:signal transduction histidine kinase
VRLPGALQSSVRVRVTSVAMLAALLVAAIGSLLFVHALHNALVQGLETSAREEAQAVVAQLRDGEQPDQAVVSGRNDVLIQVVDADGTVVASDHPRVRSALMTAAGTASDVRVKGLSDSYVAVALPAPGDRVVAVGRSDEGVEKATEAVALLLAVSVPVGLGLLAVAVWLAIGRALRPVEEMRREASSISAAHVEKRLAVSDGDDEIPRLASTLNQMLDRIDVSSRLQRQFVSDASHELRSPLAVIRQLAELARDYPHLPGAQTLARDVLVEERRMEELVTALLLLARLDDEAERVAQPVDLDDLVLEEVRRVRDRREDVQVDAGGVGAAQLDGDPVLLGQLAANLLGNAVRHARSEVRVLLSEEDDAAVLVVEDDGNGVPPEERERVFQRFVRLDESRTRDQGGSGLGLAIVEKVVRAHGGTVTVGEAPSGGAAFRVVLPLG